MKLGAGSLRARGVPVGSLVCLALVLAGEQARAQRAAPSGAAPGGEDLRTALYREATEAAASGQWAEARDRLRAAIAIRASPKVLFSLAQAEEKLGAVASAQADYVRALEGARAAGETDVVRVAEQARVSLESRVPHVRLIVTNPSGGAPSGATATLDEHPMAVGATVALDPGAHRVVVNAPGMREVTTSVAIGERQQLDVPVHMVTETIAPVLVVPSGLAPGPSAGTWRTVGLIVAGVGVVGLGVGTAFGVESIAKHNAAHTACPGVTCADAASAGLWNDAVSTGNVSTVAFIAGGVLVAGGAVLWWVGPRSNAAGPQVGVGPGSVQLQGVW
jgi:hypothetical protein